MFNFFTKHIRAFQRHKTYQTVALSPAGKQFIEQLASSDASTLSFQRRMQSQHSDDVQDQSWIAWINEQTKQHNRNNVTRTAAYLSIYNMYPELHWALLAHIVSRNAGWHMTDLAGPYFKKIMNRKQRQRYFRLLETCNALIFQDAYPQLLLYHYSRRSNANKFYLLSHFHVSSFMTPIWHAFITNKDTALITVALIINEQHYIEKRVVQNPRFQDGLLSSMLFKSQLPLQLNQLYLPWGQDELAGLIMERFADLDERIEIGKKLYCILFGFPEINQGVRDFCHKIKHSGSRADYNGHRYAASKTEALGDKIYSPVLKDAWADMPLQVTDRSDWFMNRAEPFKYFNTLKPPWLVEMNAESNFALAKIKTAASLKNFFKPMA